jgi:hypothetical protein
MRIDRPTGPGAVGGGGTLLSCSGSGRRAARRWAHHKQLSRSPQSSWSMSGQHLSAENGEPQLEISVVRMDPHLALALSELHVLLASSPEGQAH